MKPLTLFEKIWAAHEVHRDEDGQSLLYVDRHFIHEGSRTPYKQLADRGLKVRRPDLTFAVPDHYVATTSRDFADVDGEDRKDMVASLTRNAAASGVVEYGLQDERHGIVHVMGPEQGLSLPGMLILCGDSHTSTHGAVGALAFGIGASEVGHVLATQTLWQRKPRTMRVLIEGELAPGVSGKDVVLALIAQIGVNGATGHVIEFAGSTMEALSVEGRLTVCNMAIEAGARAGMVAPDDKTFAYLRERPHAPKGEAWEAALERWRGIVTDPGAIFDREVFLDATTIEPMVTWGNRPSEAVPVTAAIPDVAAVEDPTQRGMLLAALDYMGLKAGTKLADVPVDYVFIGSCTNGRIEDFRAAAAVLRGRQVAPGVKAIAVPGSGLVRAQAEAEGLDRVFTEAGFEWRFSGCSMCLAVNGDTVPPGKRSASTSNRNFVGRQGPDARTHLVSPATAAATAIAGRFADHRALGG
ncbi:3-isopropylmalate dehydratase large subunit [Rhodovarius crocodyli]|uniref:3-isopropylmalate dehydratase large subunit n=1 Tax=Rhodovarius crocodyli TaxID=1979269 RepID=A0A437M2L4_9PROT|nr:3-isopropylmalate dehydratase large subunit [Rhodovarius crocodyli]RVT91783.1 3-isopropylmalate dehydratase large subunit [Rhodovarius crocodyli]